MTNYLHYNESSVNAVAESITYVEQELNTLAGQINNLSMQGLDYVQNTQSNPLGSLIQADIYNLSITLKNQARRSSELSGFALQAIRLMDNAENMLMSFVGAFAPAKQLLDFISGGVIDKTEKFRDIMAELNDKMAQLVKDFDDVIAVVLMRSVDFNGVVEGDGRLAATAIKEDYINSMHKPIKGYGEMNVKELFKQNPDILRKGVLISNDGKPWDPEKQMQCTLYAAARRTMLGKPLPANGRWGNAGSWAASARKAGANVDRIPNPGDVFCQQGSLGHVGVVEAVNPDGSILISEGNYGNNGAYNLRTIKPSGYAGWEFIS